MNHYPADAHFIEGIIFRLPQSIAASVRNTYGYQYGNAGRQAANHYLLIRRGITRLAKPLLTHSDETLRTKAERLAKVCNVN